MIIFLSKSGGIPGVNKKGKMDQESNPVVPPNTQMWLLAISQ